MIDQRLLDPHEAKAYWANVYGFFRASEGASEASLLAPVCHPEAAGGVSRLLNRIQRRAVEHALRFCEPSGGFETLRALDVGCGTGRWSRTLADLGAGVVGVDLSPDAVSICRRRVPEGEFICSDATELAGHVEGRFGLILSVTVLQHIHFHEQPLALEQIRKVLAPGGYFVMLEHTRAQGQHMFARSPDGWQEVAGACGLEPVAFRPYEFLPFSLLLDAVKGSRMGGKLTRYLLRRGVADLVPQNGEGEVLRHPLQTLLRTLFRILRTGAIGASYLSEPSFRKLGNPRWATHGTFVFRGRD